jgi:hypothetical protein
MNWLRKLFGGENPSDPRTIKGAIHAAVERQGLKTGDRFRVGTIMGEVGEHHSPWHITYTAEIERIGGS